MRVCEEWETNCGKGVSVYSDAYVYDKLLGSPSQSCVLKLFDCLQWPSISRLWLKRSPKENILSEDCLATLIIDNSAVVATIAGIDLHKLKRHHIFLTSAFGDESVKGCRGEKVKGRRGEVATLHLKFSKDRSKTATPFCATLTESQSRSVDLHVRLVTESL